MSSFQSGEDKRVGTEPVGAGISAAATSSLAAVPRRKMFRHVLVVDAQRADAIWVEDGMNVPSRCRRSLMAMSPSDEGCPFTYSPCRVGINHYRRKLMANVVVVGAQWAMKGKLLISIRSMPAVIRYQGNNAGHSRRQ
jgi:hypothetical protein